MQTTTRPGDILPELWFSMSQKEKKAAIEEWKIEGPRRVAERAKNGIPEFIPEADVDEFWKSIEEARAKYEIPYAPAMPVVGKTFLFQSSIQEEGEDEPESEDEKPSVTREHQDHFACPGTVTPEYFALIHTPLSIGDAMRIPDAKKALMAEWDKLKAKRAWLPDTVCEREAVIGRARKENKTMHFGELMELCHEKHSELPPEQRKYKGRIVFRGDKVKDETGFYAVFSEQGTSASHLAAAKVLDAIARMP